MITQNSFTADWINQVSKRYKADKILVEKSIRALSLLEGLSESSLPFTETSTFLWMTFFTTQWIMLFPSASGKAETMLSIRCWNEASNKYPATSSLNHSTLRKPFCPQPRCIILYHRLKRMASQSRNTAFGSWSA